tara:strand:+ start:544 stop:1368 length:825 start_codon:yes stop_codon:yes gene_type:complete
MYKQFNDEQINTYQFRSHKTYTLNQSQVVRKQFLSESLDETADRYYKFARINLYLSGSDLANEGAKYNTIPTVGDPKNNDKMFFRKFYNSGSLLFISQSQFGDGVKKGSVVLNDTTTGAKLVDDLNGNLYSTNASFSQSVTSLSSSDNYVGNVFYDIGVVSITETASFDGSNDYKDATSGDYTLQFKATKDIVTYEYVCEAMPNEFNKTTNDTIFSEGGRGQLKGNLTSSNFPTFVTEIGLYDDDRNLMGIAKLSKPVPKSTKIPMRFFVRMDY